MNMQVWLFVLLSLTMENTLMPADPTVPLTDQTQIVFASSQLGRELIAAKDQFLERMQPLERQIRLQSSTPVSEQTYVESLQDGVLEWKSEEIDQLTASIERLQPQLAKYKLALPEKIFLVRVAASVESDAPHCRGPAIILPDSFLADAAQQPKVLAHELFHVLSNHNQELRDQLYSIIGFQRCTEIRLPPPLKERRLTNPDAPTYEHFITLDYQDAPIDLTPITITKFSEYQDTGLFQSIDFRLLVLTDQAGQKTAKLDEQGQVHLLSVSEVPDYFDKIGRNTGYIIHPEETLADNFWMMVLETPEVPDPWIIERMKEVFEK